MEQVDFRVLEGLTLVSAELTEDDPELGDYIIFESDTGLRYLLGHVPNPHYEGHISNVFGNLNSIVGGKIQIARKIEKFSGAGYEEDHEVIFNLTTSGGFCAMYWTGTDWTGTEYNQVGLFKIEDAKPEVLDHVIKHFAYADLSTLLVLLERYEGRENSIRRRIVNTLNGTQIGPKMVVENREKFK